ncbi:MAG: 50S ribosomal protein L4 [Planctomycetes bacterium]|nr:50S ribosomal protein L4 [Planctomycetota bacterium]
MLEIPVYSLAGKQTGTIKLDEQLLGGEIRPTLLKQAYVMYHANKRQGTSATKNRSQVEGSTRKLYRQKGTGNARRGAVRTNIMKGGGVAFGKRTKDWRQDMPVKMRRLATRNAMLAKAVDGEIKVVDSFDFKAPKTKQFVSVLSALGIDRTCLLAINPQDANTRLSARNVADIQIIHMDQLNAYDLLSRRFVLVDKATLEGWIDSLKSSANVEEAA